mmetsp:Transcript_16406/g.37985  ORF Transcript_16406/g.37985 Transcript_16406/m.37985 type:complete len:216 (-) Transcript_16406:170-817(-)
MPSTLSLDLHDKTSFFALGALGHGAQGRANNCSMGLSTRFFLDEIALLETTLKSNPDSRKQLVTASRVRSISFGASCGFSVENIFLSSRVALLYSTLTRHEVELFDSSITVTWSTPSMPLIIVSIIVDLPTLPSLFPQVNRLTRKVISIFGDIMGASSLLSEKSSASGGGGGADPMTPQNRPNGGSPGSPTATHGAVLPSSSVFVACALFFLAAL